jgi:hypothetical protein
MILLCGRTTEIESFHRSLGLWTEEHLVGDELGSAYQMPLVHCWLRHINMSEWFAFPLCLPSDGGSWFLRSWSSSCYAQQARVSLQPLCRRRTKGKRRWRGRRGLVFSSLNRCLDCYVVAAFFSLASKGTGGLMKVQGPMGLVVALVIIGFMTRGRFRRDYWRTEPVKAGAPV